MKSLRYRVSIIIVFLFACSFLFSQQAEVSVRLEPEVIETGSRGKIQVTYVFPEGLHQILQEDYFFFEVAEIPGITLEEIVYPTGKIEADGFIHLYGEVVLTRELNITHDAEPGSYELAITAGYQLCYDNTGTCIMPEEEELKTTLEVLPSSTSPTQEPILLYLLFALLGGIILNLTPCVLPVLSLRAFTLIKDSQADKKKITLNSLTYSLGILFSFLSLAIIVIILKASGEYVGWGFQFQNPIFVLVLTSVIFVFSLSLFDVFVISLPDAKVTAKMTSKRGLAGSFFNGSFCCSSRYSLYCPDPWCCLSFCLCSKTSDNSRYVPAYRLGYGSALYPHCL